MRNYKTFFKGKLVTVVGLGLLGKRLGDIAFLSQCGAKVLVTDLKSSSQLKPSIQKLRKYKNIKYVLGRHRMQDFENCDFVLKGQGVALDSPFIAHAKKFGIPIEMDESLFAKLAPDVKIVGITGTRGKSTVTTLIYKILKKAGKRVHLGGNIRGTAALPLLKFVKKGDIAVFELSSWQLQGFAEDGISPSISVFTNFMPDHMNYYENKMERYFTDKSYIYKFQKKGDVLVLGSQMKSIKNDNSKILRASVKNIPKSWRIKLKGVHNLENIACALSVARAMKISDQISRKAIENFKAIPGRLELVKKVRGVEIYNDTNSTTPEATIAALQSFSKRVILIMGGTDKGLPIKNLLKILPKRTKKIFLMPGTGSKKVTTKANIEKVKDLKEAVKSAVRSAKSGDVILFSPAFASFGTFLNEYDRGDKFMKIVKSLK